MRKFFRAFHCGCGVSLAHHSAARGDFEDLAGFGVFKPYGTHVGKRFFAWIHEGHGDKVVTAPGDGKLL